MLGQRSELCDMIRSFSSKFFSVKQGSCQIQIVENCPANAFESITIINNNIRSIDHQNILRILPEEFLLMVHQHKRPHHDCKYQYQLFISYDNVHTTIFSSGECQTMRTCIICQLSQNIIEICCADLQVHDQTFDHQY